MMRRFISLLFFLAATSAVAAPAPPGTDLWLADLTVGDAIAASNPRNLTARPGYDNQPAFVTNHSLLFTSMDASGQTDAWRYDLQGDVQPVLVTPESEYSPTPAPGGAMSVVRVAMDGVQQLWLMKPGALEYEVLFPMLEGVGYHAWLDSERVALFMLRDSMELHIANRNSGEVAVLAKDIGRSLQPIPGLTGSLAFTEPGQDGKRWIKRLDVNARKIVSLAPLLEGSEDFILLPDQRAVMAQDRALHVWNGEAWQQFAQFDQLPGPITRLALSPDAKRLALVVAEGE